MDVLHHVRCRLNGYRLWECGAGCDGVYDWWILEGRGGVLWVEGASKDDVTSRW